MGAMAELGGVELPLAVCKCCDRLATHAKKRLCRACYMAVQRATKRGESWDQAAEHRRRGLERRAKGWVR